ncbi:MAG: DUF1501 domain-containing protein [Alphaproteobacteria bacterium]|nr:DUF1501 domain-containing protein [Alphaproteobacteria bacterium]
MWSRRRLLTHTAALAGAASTWGALPRRAHAASPDAPRLVVCVLRGGLDGLLAVPPVGDPDYASARGPMALSPDERATAIRLDDTFALHPALAALAPLWAAGELLPVHATATAYRGRSHFDAQDALESGLPGAGRPDAGWLGRTLSLAPPPTPPMAVGRGVPLLLRGAPDATAVDPVGLGLRDDALSDRLAALYLDDPLLGPALARGVAARAVADEAGMGHGGPQGLGRLGDVVARLMVDPGGPTVVTLDVPGWDSHARERALTGRLAGLADAVVALRTGLGALWSRTVVVVVTEFGRTVAGNGTDGTDHGTGGVALLAGGAVAGGRVLADWPGLGRGTLLDGRDLRPTTDLRSVLAGVVGPHLGVTGAALRREVFPDAAGIPSTPDLVRAGR